MRPSRRWYMLIIVLSVFPYVLRGQTDSVFFSADDPEFTLSDSLSIFELIDSLIQQFDAETSQIAIRLSYNSNVLSAGRTLGIENFGLAPGVSFYHKTGLFADVSAYWSRDFEPDLYLVTASAGYIHVFSKKFSMLGGFDKYFYTDSEADKYIPYRNTISLSPYLELKPFTFRVDYGLYFGDKTAHRIGPSIGLNLTGENLMKIDRVSFYPGFSVLLGNETYTEIRMPESRLEWIQALIRYRNGQSWYTIVDKSVFGVMNYSFIFPLSITHGNWNLFLNYAYSIPKALPGEPFALENSSFVSGSFTYTIDILPR